MPTATHLRVDATGTFAASAATFAATFAATLAATSFAAPAAFPPTSAVATAMLVFVLATPGVFLRWPAEKTRTRFRSWGIALFCPGEVLLLLSFCLYQLVGVV